MTTLFFATDIHGSEVCWRKFLNAGAHYDAEILVLGGDMTGKAMVPIIARDQGFEASLEDRRYELADADEVQAFEKRVADRGYYPVRLEPDEAAALRDDEAAVDRLFERRMLETIERWMEIAAEKLEGSGIRCFVCPGNDDVFAIDEILERSSHIEIGEGTVADLDGFEMASLGWTNPTPWDTHRETSEEDLARRIEATLSGISEPERAIFNFHVPPYDSGLDMAPAIDAELNPRGGGSEMEPVGSTAVRDAITEREPILSLHGHVHEGRAAVRLGRTLAINPGSAYDEGVLQGALISLNARKGKVKDYVLLEG